MLFRSIVVNLYQYLNYDKKKDKIYINKSMRIFPFGSASLYSCKTAVPSSPLSTSVLTPAIDNNLPATVNSLSKRGGEEIPVGGWRGGEEIPVGGWR